MTDGIDGREEGGFEARRVEELQRRAIQYKDADPEAALTKARQAVESIAKRIYRDRGFDKGGRPIDKLELNDVLARLEKEEAVPKHVALSMRTIQFYGNFGTHDQGAASARITPEFTQTCLQALAVVAPWFRGEYLGLPPDAPARPPEATIDAPRGRGRTAAAFVAIALVVSAAFAAALAALRSGRGAEVVPAAAPRPVAIDAWYAAAEEPTPPEGCRAPAAAWPAVADALAQTKSPRRALALLEGAGRTLSAEERFVRATLAAAAGGDATADAEAAAGCGGFAAAQNLAGKLALQRGAVDEALLRFDAAISIRSSYFKPRFNRCLALIRLARGPEALPPLEQLAIEAPGRGEVHFALAHARLAAGRAEEAKAAFCKAASLGIADAAKGCGG